MADEQLLKQLREIGPTPCETYSCSHRAECSAEEKACSAFRWWVETGAIHSPNLFIPEIVSKNHQPELREDAEPTREIFESLDIDDGENYRRPIMEKKQKTVIPQAIESMSELQKVWG